MFTLWSPQSFILFSPPDHLRWVRFSKTPGSSSYSRSSLCNAAGSLAIVAFPGPHSQLTELRVCLERFRCELKLKFAERSFRFCSRGFVSDGVAQANLVDQFGQSIGYFLLAGIEHWSAGQFGIFANVSRAASEHHRQ